MNFAKFKNEELIDYLAKYNVTDEDIKGSGKNGRVIRTDRIRAAKKVYIEYPQITPPILPTISPTISPIKTKTSTLSPIKTSTLSSPTIPMETIGEISKYLPITTSRLINKQLLKENECRYQQSKKPYRIIAPQGKTVGLKKGDYVLFDKDISVVYEITKPRLAIVIPIEGKYKGLYLETERKLLTMIELPK